MDWKPLGDAAFMSESAGAGALAKRMRREAPAACLDIVSSYDQVAVYFQPEDHAEICRWLESELPPETEKVAVRRHRIPVFYDEELLEALTRKLDLTSEEIISLHCSACYKVAAVGFSPGFPYLTGLPERLHLPRRSSPVKLPAGSVAIAADQAGIYPTRSLGGWHSLGRTSFSLFDGIEAALEPGDEVTFYAIEEEPVVQENEGGFLVKDPAVEVLSPGPASSIQDGGRAGFRHLGVTAGGAVDVEAAAAANLLVGNPAAAPLLEFGLVGPSLKFLREVCVSYQGLAGPRPGAPQTIPKGGTLNLDGRPLASYGYLAIAGGFHTRRILGSASVDVRAGLGRVLRRGDLLDSEAPFSIPNFADGQSVRWPRGGGYLTLRVLPGWQEDWFSESVLEEFYEEAFEKSSHFDRTGARLSGCGLNVSEVRELRSQPTAPGAIQVPPSGEAIVLTAECQTIGGYPVIAHLITADLPSFTRALPGTILRFQKVTLEEARQAYDERGKELSFLKTGLSLL